MECMVNSLDTVISPEYRELNRKLHEGPFGSGGGALVDDIKRFIPLDGDILDYGCGKQTLSRKLGANVTDYDPCIPGLDAVPEPHDFLVCLDVLEHIEPEYLDNVLADLKRVTKRIGYLRICTRKAKKTLSDGRNAHLIIETQDWWLAKLAGFSIDHAETSGDWLTVVYEAP